jgi:hypothetical protein
MRFLSRSDRGGENRAGVCEPRPGEVVSYDSVSTARSRALPGVTFTINRISFGRRMDLTKRVREISQKAEFLEAGTGLKDKVEANVLAQEIEEMYLRWALVSVDGLRIDGEPATIEKVIEKGPDDLTREIVTAIKAQCGLSETERKN